MNHFTLAINDESVNRKFKEHRYNQIQVPFAVYQVAEFMYTLYGLFMLNSDNFKDWMLEDETNLLEPTTKQRTFYLSLSLIGIVIIVAVFALARIPKLRRCYDAICILTILKVTLLAYLSQNFDPRNPREYIYWAILLIFHNSFIFIIFGVNGTLDMLASAVIPGVGILAQGVYVWSVRNDAGFTSVPIVFAIIAVSVFNYILHRE